MDNLIIRNEQEKDHRAVEETTREAFWNQYVPGCDEHYLVHAIRKSPDFIPALAFVAELDGAIVGSIFFTKSCVVDEHGTKHDTITFGPVSVLPAWHNKGIGAKLIDHAIDIAKELGYKAILIYGYEGYYRRFGFRHAKEYCISNPDGKYPAAHMALELAPDALRSISGKAYESDVFEIDAQKAAAYDTLFPLKKKETTPSQKAFAKAVNTFL